VAVRGAARRLVAGMLAVNPPDVVRRVFPGSLGGEPRPPARGPAPSPDGPR